MQNPFITLGVPETATEQQVHLAYRRLVKECHPDIQPGEAEKESAQARLIALNLAYEEALRRTSVKASAAHAPSPRIYSLVDTNRLAARLLRQKMFDSALRVLERCGEADETWHFLRGQALVGLGRPQEAHDSFRQAVRLCPDNNEYRRAALSAFTAAKKQQRPLGRVGAWAKNVLHK